MVSLFNRNVVDYPGTTANSSVNRTPPQVTQFVSQDKILFQTVRAAFVVTSSDFKPAASSASHQNGSCEAGEKEN